MATTYRIVHQPDATPDTPYNVRVVTDGRYCGRGRFCKTLAEAVEWAGRDASPDHAAVELAEGKRA